MRRAVIIKSKSAYNEARAFFSFITRTSYPRAVDAEVQIHCYDFEDFNKFATLKVSDHGYSFIDAFYDGEFYFVARNISLLECYSSSGALIWIKNLSSFVDHNPIASIQRLSNYSEFTFVCCLSKVDDDLLFVSKIDGSIIRFLSTPQELDNFYISTNNQLASSAEILYDISNMRIRGIIKAKKCIVAACVHENIFYVAHSNGIDVYSTGVLQKSVVFENDMLKDFIIISDEIAVLTRGLNKKYNVYIVDLFLGSKRQILEFESTNVPIFLRGKNRFLVSCLLSNQITENVNSELDLKIVTWQF